MQLHEGYQVGIFIPPKVGNFTPPMTKVFHDPILTAALLDRITHRALVMNMNGMSFRQR